MFFDKSLNGFEDISIDMIFDVSIWLRIPLTDVRLSQIELNVHIIDLEI